jgi:outer membrane receptor protein involved in Fe transport
MQLFSARLVSVLFLLFGILQPALSQRPDKMFKPSQGRFYGKVVDEQTGKSIAYATVQLFKASGDSTRTDGTEQLVSGQLTQENGDFSLENIPTKGSYTLRINYLGYAKFEKTVGFGSVYDLDLGNLRLSTSTELLNEVIITGDADAVQLAMDKKVYRVDKDAMAAGGTAEDALQNVPSITVDIDGNMTLRNAAPQLFVDGRPTPLTIDQIPADAIETIEVITNPSSRYDASGGNAGIVNIVLKKNRRIGYNGDIRGGVDSRNRYNIGGNINAREGKLNAFLGGRYNARKSITTGETDRLNRFEAPFTSVFQATEGTSDRKFYSLRAGLDWFVDNRNTFTLSGSYFGGDNISEDIQDIFTDTIYDTYTTQGTAVRTTTGDRFWEYTGAQALFKHLFPKDGKEWTADANFYASNNGGSGIYQTSTPLYESRQQRLNSGSNNSLTVQTDYVDPISNNMKLETGLRAFVRNFSSENGNYEYDYVDEQFVQVRGFADTYEFVDQVYAAYGSFAHSFAKWGYQAGLRAESSRYEGKLPDADTSFQNSYPLSLFPSIFFTFKLNEEDNLQLNYSRRINRPSFFQIIPYTDFSDSLLLSRGNPGLIPEFTNSLEFSYQNIINAKHNFLTSIYFKHATDLITAYQFEEYNEVLQRSALVSSYQNANASYAYGFEFTTKDNFGKVVETTTNLNLYNSVVNATNVDSTLQTEQFSWFIKENINLRLPAAFTIQLSGEYRSRTAFALSSESRHGGWHGGPSSTAQGYTIPNWRVDLSVRKDLWERKGSITLSVRDVFRSRKTGSYSASPFFVQDSWRLRDPQLVRLNFSYRFGKFDESLFKRKNNKSSDGGGGMEGGF